MANLRGIVDRITYQSADSGYTVARVQPDDRPLETVTVVGSTLSLTPGECLAMEGDWATHPKFGRQFKIESYRKVYPTSVEGIRRYLGSGLMKGIGPVTAKRIVAHFGDGTLEVIERAPQRLTEVPGLGPKRAGQIKEAWARQREIHNVMLFLQSHDVGTGHAVKIWKEYGQGAVAAIRENPYRLSKDVWGMGFLTADRIAQKMGVAPESEQRVSAGLRHVLETSSQSDGHVYLPREAIISAASEALGVPADLVEPGLERLLEEKEVVVEEDRVYLPPHCYAERGVATKLHQLSRISRVEEGDVGAEIGQIEERFGVKYASEQSRALAKGLTEGALVITGGPGTGKTTIIRGLVALLEARKQRIALAAPTGRAAKRLSEATGREASTLHRLLRFTPQTMSFEKNHDDPLEFDAVVVDEVSMVDVLLMNALLRAVPLTASLVLVGDVDQLPSVGPGSVLKDVIASGVVTVVALNEIYRQAKASQIVMNAHAILGGEVPDLTNAHDSNFFFLEEEDPERVAETVVGLCKGRLPSTYGLDPIDGIQVLAPMYRGATGATNLNTVLQDALNPDGAELIRGGTRYRSGDKVMQVRNNYDKEVYNGDVGRILEMDTENQNLRVSFPDRIVDYGFDEIDELVLAYAVSVHKSQGSEYRSVVLPITTQHYMMLQRNLLYTAITRAKELAVLVGTRKALGIAVQNNRVGDRYTWLARRIQANAASSGREA